MKINNSIHIVYQTSQIDLILIDDWQEGLDIEPYFIFKTQMDSLIINRNQ